MKNTIDNLPSGTWISISDGFPKNFLGIWVKLYNGKVVKSTHKNDIYLSNWDIKWWWNPNYGDIDIGHSQIAFWLKVDK